MNPRLLIIFIISLALLFFIYLAQPNSILENKNSYLSMDCYKVFLKTIRGNSMFPLLQNGERVKVLYGYYDCYPLLRNDLVVISFKTQPSNFYVKRVVGLPNDKVEIKDEYIYLNNNLLTNSRGEPYIVKGKGVNLLLKPLTNNIIPQGYYLVLSEEVNSLAFDSRYFGYIEKTHIKGKVIK